ncbi:hypothetical protein Pan258_16290 [Symmachiella dynata]|nr:hypothetical protein Pan258_16290 [Symmachiella dynata]
MRAEKGGFPRVATLNFGRLRNNVVRNLCTWRSPIYKSKPSRDLQVRNLYRLSRILARCTLNSTGISKLASGHRQTDIALKRRRRSNCY